MSETDPEGWEVRDRAPTLSAWPRDRSDGGTDVAVVAFAQNTREEVRLIGGDGQRTGTISANQGSHQTTRVATDMRVRRLTPTECERLQGFPDGWTKIPWKNKPADACPDGPRYKALGNSWAVPCVQWIFRRLNRALTWGHVPLPILPTKVPSNP